MTAFDELPARLQRATDMTAQAVSFDEVPLVIANESDQWLYLQVLPTVLNGTVLYASAPDALTQALYSMGQTEYLFLVLDGIAPDVGDLVRHYLYIRTGESGDAIVEHRFGRGFINPEHRLILICDHAMGVQWAPYIQQHVTFVAVRNDT